MSSVAAARSAPGEEKRTRWLESEPADRSFASVRPSFWPLPLPYSLSSAAGGSIVARPTASWPRSLSGSFQSPPQSISQTSLTEREGARAPSARRKEGRKEEEPEREKEGIYARARAQATSTTTDTITTTYFLHAPKLSLARHICPARQGARPAARPPLAL